MSPRTKGWKARSAKEVGKKNDPLMGPGGGDELPLVGQPVRDVAGQVASAAQSFDVLHLPPALDITGEG